MSNFWTEEQLQAIDLENKLAFVYFQQMTDTGFSYVSRRCKNIIYSSLLN